MLLAIKKLSQLAPPAPVQGATCQAWFNAWKAADDDASRSKNRGLLGADLFGSACYTFQHGKFSNYFGDLTRVDARLDIGSASALAKKVSGLIKRRESAQSSNLQGSPRLNLIFQQQVYGPIVFRVDSRVALDSSSKCGAQLEDMIYSLSYSLRLLASGKVVAWYSSKQKEGMVELRMFEF